MTFQEKVLQVVKTISHGQTMTYQAVAAEAGRPGAARAVGNIMSQNWDPAIPCHRVIRSDGKTGGYNRGAKKKSRLLKEEQGS